LISLFGNLLPIIKNLMPSNPKTWGNQLQIRVGGNLVIEEESLAITLGISNKGNG
jgi:hypothetical protein